MNNEKLQNKKLERKEKGISTFLLLLLLTIGVVLVGFLIMLFGIYLFEKSLGAVDGLPLTLAIINIILVAILMVFFYFSLRGLRDLRKAAAAAERGEAIGQSGGDGDIADLINVVGRVSSRMSIYKDKQTTITDDYLAFVPRGILEYCHVDMHKEIPQGVIGTIKGTRVIIMLGNYKVGTDPREFANLVGRIMGRGGRMLSSTSESICAIFPGAKEEDVRFLEAEMKESQILNVRHGTFEIVMVGSRTSMHIRARELAY